MNLFRHSLLPVLVAAVLLLVSGRVDAYRGRRQYLGRQDPAFTLLNKNKKHHKDALLINLRGGALGMDPNVAGKIFTGIWLAQGLAFSLAPKPTAEFYGITDSPESEFIAENLGGAITTTGITSLYCTRFQKLDSDSIINHAMGWAGVSWLLHHYKWYLNNTYSKVGFKITNAYFTTFTSLLTAYAGFYEPEWATAVYKAMIAIYSISAIHGILLPGKSLEFWGCNKVDDDTIKFAMKAFMFHLLAYQIHQYCIIQGMEPHRAIAYASLPILVLFVVTLKQDIPKTIKKPFGYQFWACLFPYLILAILGEDAVSFLSSSTTAGPTSSVEGSE